MLKIQFSNNLQHAKFQNFLPLTPIHGDPSGATKTSQFYIIFLNATLKS